MREDKNGHSIDNNGKRVFDKRCAECLKARDFEVTPPLP